LRSDARLTTEGPPDFRPTALQTWSAAGSSSPEDLEKLSLSSPERAEPTSLLNHETSDHLLSLVDSLCRMNHRESADKSCFDFF
jgi:hypothetical protein